MITKAMLTSLMYVTLITSSSKELKLAIYCADVCLSETMFLNTASVQVIYNRYYGCDFFVHECILEDNSPFRFKQIK